MVSLKASTIDFKEALLISKLNFDKPVEVRTSKAPVSASKMGYKTAVPAGALARDMTSLGSTQLSSK